MPIPGFTPSGQSDGSESSNDVVGTYRVRRGAMAPPGSPSQWGYTGGMAVSLYGGEGPGSTASSGRFTPYRDNDMTRILNGIASAGTIYDMQLALIQAGFLDEDAVLGYIDGDTANAFEQVLAVANQHGMRWEDVLSQAAQGGGGLYDNGGDGRGGGSLQQGPVVTLPNRDDLVAGVDDLTFSQYGVKVDQDLQEAAADAVLDVLRTHQERQVQREMSATGTDVTFTESAPDVARLLDEQIRERRPGLVMEKGVRDAMDSWFSALAGPV